jgi:hypothetical protein
MQDVTQAFAVYPERPELINKSTLMKIEGTIGDEEVAMAMRKREGWVLVMPELEAGVPQANETIRWLVGKLIWYITAVAAHVLQLQLFTTYSRYMDDLVLTLGIPATKRR